MLRESESLAAESNGLPPLGKGSDRQAAHYYRAMHARAVQREEQWKERALAAEDEEVRRQVEGIKQRLERELAERHQWAGCIELSITPGS